MQRSIQKNGLRLILCLVLLGSFAVVHADDQTPANKPSYRQEVRDRLRKLQATLDLMFANHQLTSDQYQAESERVRLLRLQTRVDAQADEVMTEDDRNTDFSLIRQINNEATQFAVINTPAINAPPPAVPPVGPTSNP